MRDHGAIEIRDAEILQSGLAAVLEFGDSQGVGVVRQFTAHGRGNATRCVGDIGPQANRTGFGANQKGIDARCGQETRCVAVGQGGNLKGVGVGQCARIEGDAEAIAQFEFRAHHVAAAHVQRRNGGAAVRNTNADRAIAERAGTGHGKGEGFVGRSGKESR